MSNLNYIIMKNLKLFIAAFALVFAVQVSANTDKPVKATAQLQSELVNLSLTLLAVFLSAIFILSMLKLCLYPNFFTTFI